MASLEKQSYKRCSFTLTLRFPLGPILTHKGSRASVSPLLPQSQTREPRKASDLASPPSSSLLDPDPDRVHRKFWLPGFNPQASPPPTAALAALSPDPGLSATPKGPVAGRGAPGAKAVWAKDVRHGERGQGEGGGTRKPGASGWQPRLQNNRTGEWGRGAAHIEGKAVQSRPP